LLEGGLSDRLADHAIHAAWPVCRLIHQVTEAGEHDDPQVRPQLFSPQCELVPGHLGHRAVGDDQIECPGAQLDQSGRATRGGFDVVSIVHQVLGHHFDDESLIVDHEDAERPRQLVCLGMLGGRRDRDTDREADPKRGPLSELALDLERPLVSGHDPVDHGQSESGPVLALRREEWL
jgi:hypothetical protein